MPKGRAESGGDFGVAFAQSQIWAQSMVFYKCVDIGMFHVELWKT